jgi:GNAT superfamily N-acetyltransferase
MSATQRPAIRLFRDGDAAASAALVRAAPDGPCSFEHDDAAALLAFDRLLRQHGHAVVRLVAEASGGLAASAALFETRWGPGGVRRGWLLLRVAPAWRGHGLATRMFGSLRDAARHAGLVTLHADVRERDADAQRWALRHGFTVQMRSILCRLDLARAAPRAIAAGAPPITTLAALQAAGVPDALGQAFALYRTLLDDVPLPDQIVLTTAWFAELVGARPDLCLIAHDGGQFIGICILQPAAGDAGALEQRLTGVIASRRGQGIATALKRTSLGIARAAGYRSIITWIEDTNAPMLAISRAAGFIEHPGLTVYHQPLAADPPAAHGSQAR